MTQQVEFGIRLPVAGPLASPDAIQRVARESEDLGFDALWVHDFIIWTEHLDSVHISVGSAEAVEAAKAENRYEPNFLESITNLAYVAGITSRVKLGIAVLCMPFRNPIIAAKQVTNVDVLSKGRLILGIGVGAVKSTGNQDFEVLQVPRGDKYRRSREYVAVMQEIWTSSAPTFQGEYISFPPTEINPKPVQKPGPPMWIGGAGPKAIEMVAEFGSGWLPGRVPAREYPDRIREIREAAQARGRGDVQFAIGSEITACIAPTTDAARSASAKTIDVLTGSGGFAQLAAQEAFASHGLIGSVDDVRRKVAAYVEGGVRHFEMKVIYHDLDHLSRQLELFSTKVLPDYR